MISKKNVLLLIFGINLFYASAKEYPDSSFILNSKTTTSSLFLFAAGYKMPVNKNIVLNSGHGLYFEGGINPGKLISKQLTIGFYIGWAWKDGLWSTSFNNNFKTDYSSSINKEAGFSSIDSAVIASSAVLLNTKGRSVTMPGCEMNSFHNYSLYYGVILKFPYKYIPAVKLYLGTTHSHYQGSGNIVTNQKDFNIFQLRRAMYGCELIIFKGLQKEKSKSFAAVSFYFESANFYNSTLYFTDGTQTSNIPLKKFMSSSFLEKYKNENCWGFKISYNIL